MASSLINFSIEVDQPFVVAVNILLVIAWIFESEFSLAPYIFLWDLLYFMPLDTIFSVSQIVSKHMADSFTFSPRPKIMENVLFHPLFWLALLSVVYTMIVWESRHLFYKAYHAMSLYMIEALQRTSFRLWHFELYGYSLHSTYENIYFTFENIIWDCVGILLFFIREAVSFLALCEVLSGLVQTKLDWLECRKHGRNARRVGEILRLNTTIHLMATRIRLLRSLDRSAPMPSPRCTYNTGIRELSSSLLSLPPEIRMTIFQYYFATFTSGRYYHEPTFIINRRALQFYPSQLALTRQLFSEARAAYFTTVVFLYKSNIPRFDQTTQKIDPTFQRIASTAGSDIRNLIIETESLSHLKSLWRYNYLSRTEYQHGRYPPELAFRNGYDFYKTVWSDYFAGRKSSSPEDEGWRLRPRCFWDAIVDDFSRLETLEIVLKRQSSRMVGYDTLITIGKLLSAKMHPASQPRPTVKLTIGIDNNTRAYDVRKDSALRVLELATGAAQRKDKQGHDPQAKRLTEMEIALPRCQVIKIRGAMNRSQRDALDDFVFNGWESILISKTGPVAIYHFVPM